MTWFKVDDKLHAHPKWWGTSPAAKALWVTAGSWAGSYNTNGLVLASQMPMLAPEVGLTIGKAKQAAAELVEAGMWRVSDDGRGWLFHQWTEFNPTKNQVQKVAAIEKERKKIQNDPDLKSAVRLRDQDLCRYCGEEVSFAARTGNLAGRYDHIIPVTKGGKTVVTNVVVACNHCNGRKYNKSVDEAEMTLLDPGTSALDAEWRLSNGSVFAQSKSEHRPGSGPGSGLAGFGEGWHEPDPLQDTHQGDDQ